MKGILKRISINAPILLTTALITYIIPNMISIYPEGSGYERSWHAVLLGYPSLASDNVFFFENAGPIFIFIGALLGIATVFISGITFIAVSFDEEHPVWFRVVSLIAVILILIGVVFTLNLGYPSYPY